MDSAKITWEPGVAIQIQERASRSSQSPFMVAVVGMPGSGKTTSTRLLCDSLNKALGIPLDGYHFPLSVLRTFPNPEDAVYRRGAPDTFDVTSLLRDLTRIRSGAEATVHVPGFDHAKGDPQENAHAFTRTQHDIVICEGLYLLHWRDIADCFDFIVYIDANVEACVERLKVRNKVIPGYTPEEIDIRVEAVDRANAMTVLRSKEYAHLVVQSTLG